MEINWDESRSKIGHQSGGLPGCVKIWKNRLGQSVGVYDAVQAGLEPFGWIVKCEEHDTSQALDRRKDAMQMAIDTRNFCSECCKYQDNEQSIETTGG